MYQNKSITLPNLTITARTIDTFLFHIVLVSNQRDAAFVLLGLLSLYTFRTRFVSFFRSNTQNCKSGVYAFTCNTCKLAFVGQTRRTMKQRYQEHIRYIRNNDPQSAYALHILKNQHEYGPMADTMSLLKHEQKTPMLIPYEQLFMQNYHKQGLLIQEQLIGDSNPLFQLITHMNTPHTQNTNRILPTTHTA